MMYRNAARRGLTLIELVVVLVVLAAVAGLLLPQLPNVLSDTRTTVGATNVKELSKALQTYNTTNFGYPEGFDALVAADGTIFPALPSNGDGVAGGDLDSFETAGGTVETAQDALFEAGVVSLMENVGPGANADWDATFKPYNLVVDGNGQSVPVDPVPTATFGDFIGLSASGKSKLNLSADADFVVLGVGNRCTVVGDGVLNAPVNFQSSRQVDGENPVYQRYAAVFQVTTDAGGTLEAARLVGVIAIEDDEILGVDDFLNTYYTQRN